MQHHSIDSADLLKAVLENSDQGIVILSPDHQVVGFNKVFAGFYPAFFQKTAKIGDDFRTHWPTEEGAREYAKFAKQALEGDKGKWMVENGNGNEKIYLDITAQSYYSKGKRLVLLMLNNVTEYQEMISDLSKYEHFFYCGISQLRAPNVAIMGLLRLYRIEEQGIEKEMLIEMIEKNAHNLDEMLMKFSYELDNILTKSE